MVVNKDAKNQENSNALVSAIGKLHPSNYYNSTYDSMVAVKNSSVKNDSCLDLQTNSSFSTDDLAQLETFDEQSIIAYMYNRFLSNQIYTYIGDILVVRKSSNRNMFLSFDISLGC